MTHERRVIHLAVVLHDLCQCTEVSPVHVRSGVHQVPQTRSLEGTELLGALNQVTELLLGAGDVIAVLTPAVEWVAQEVIDSGVPTFTLVIQPVNGGQCHVVELLVREGGSRVAGPAVGVPDEERCTRLRVLR